MSLYTYGKGERHGASLGKIQSAEAPTGEGWIKLSESIYMCNLQPLKKGVDVYKGKQKVGKEWRDIAVKLIPHSDTDVKEISLHLKLDHHPNIIRIIDAGEIHGVVPHVYIAMELCSQTLKDFIDECKQFPFDFRHHFNFAKQIVCGVASIHKHNILHRDIKLENILLSSTKENIRVADFGLSTQLKDGYSDITASARGLGSDGYRAPELLHEKPTTSFRSDSFSIGIVLAMLFSKGDHPFGPDPARWRTNISDNKGRDLSIIASFKEPYAHKREQLVDLIEICLQRKASRRPTPQEMMEHEFFTDDAVLKLEVQDESGQLGRFTDSSQSEFINETRSSEKSTNIEAKNRSSEAKKNDVTEESQPAVAPVIKDEVTELSTRTEMSKDADEAQSTTQDNKSEVSAPSTEPKSSDSKEGPLALFLKSKTEDVKRMESEMASSLRGGRFEEYSQILKKLTDLQSTVDLDVVVQLAEYELMSNKNDSPIMKIRDLVTSSRTRSALEIRQMGLSLKRQGKDVQAFILFKVSYDLQKLEANYVPDGQLAWINDTVIAVSSTFDPMIANGGWCSHIAKTYGIKYSDEMLADLRAVKGASPGVQALRDISCIVSITSNTLESRDYDKCIQCGEEGIKLMKQRLGESTMFYKDYGGVLNNLGNAYDHVGQYLKAVQCYNEAIEAHAMAQDYDDEDERQKDIASTKQNLANTNGKILKDPK